VITSAGFTTYGGIMRLFAPSRTVGAVHRSCSGGVGGGSCVWEEVDMWEPSGHEIARAYNYSKHNSGS